jgi:crotonobetainyl-CoA:carnitine CoA-transferase CaiB-like acyl-CoA transferase
VEGPKFGDGNRTLPPLTTNGDSINHLYLNVGTRSLAIDTRSPAWPEVVAAVARWADVVIVGNRPTAARKRGIDWASIVAHNPEIVYCMITGYGLEGPWADYPAHGLNMDVLAGTVPVEWEDGQPYAPASYRSIGTTLAGIQAALGVMTGLHRRAQGLGAQFVHVSIWETALSWMWRDLVTYANTGDQWSVYRDYGTRYTMYKGSDDKVILVCPTEQHFWERFCDTLGLDAETRARGDWSGGADFGEDYEGEREAIQERMLSKTATEWNDLLAEADVPAALVIDWREAMASEHAQVNGAMLHYPYKDRSADIPMTPVSVTSGLPATATTEELAAAHRTKGRDLGQPPDLGEQTAELLAEIGVPHLIDELTP